MVSYFISNGLCMGGHSLPSSTDVCTQEFPRPSSALGDLLGYFLGFSTGEKEVRQVWALDSQLLPSEVAPSLSVRLVDSK